MESWERQLVRFAADPGDNSASDRIALEPSYIGATRTTCVATMLRGGHAENALPQSATVTINCRVYPGVPVAEIKAQLAKVVDNDAIEFVELGEATVSPMSELRQDVMAAVSKNRSCSLSRCGDYWLHGFGCDRRDAFSKRRHSDLGDFRALYAP